MEAEQPDQFEALHIEGLATSFSMNWQPFEHCVFELSTFPKPIVVPFIPAKFPSLADHVCAICVEQADGRIVAVDLVASNYDSGPVTHEARAALFQRLGVSPIYQQPRDFSSSPVLESLRELERELILYLQRHPEKMRDVNADLFEKLVAELMANFGFDVEWTARRRNTAADVIAFKTDLTSGLRQNYIIECKRNSEKNKVGIEIARSLYGAKVDEGFSNALLVTTSYFEKGVMKFAAKRWDFELRDFRGLVEWLNAYRPPQDGKLHMEGRRLKLTH